MAIYHRPKSRPRKWRYDAAADKYELPQKSLDNLNIGKQISAERGAANRQVIADMRAVGASAKAIAAETGLNLFSVYRHIRALEGSKPVRYRCARCHLLVSVPHECDPLML